jgi:two-component system CheB/CheR fusion protein
MSEQQDKHVVESVQDSIAADDNTATLTFPIVAIGASAGGLEAFEQFFHHVRKDPGLAFVLISHLDPSHASLLTEILQRATDMPVIEAVDQASVQVNHVYIIPPNREMGIFHGSLQLGVPTLPRGQRMSIDVFFKSLANDAGRKAIGIILSGTGMDGTQGASAILGVGGITLVQEPSTAKYDGMPTNAINAGFATCVLPVEKMPEMLYTNIQKLLCPVEKPLATGASGGINQILMQLRTQTGHDFSQYKKTTICRRIEHRMLLHCIDDIGIYARYLKENPAELRLLFKEMLINVTSFFRDKASFEVLEKEVLPMLLNNKSLDAPLRIWVAGCATGEEAYSMAILLQEFMDATRQVHKVQIYSTDLDDDAITVARSGYYPSTISQNVSPARLSRFFVIEDSGYRVKKEVREMVVFAIQNVIKDAPFTRLDLLSCRNLMIYLTQELQDRLIGVFHYALKPGGVLFLSPSESIGNNTDLFTVLNRQWKLYSANKSLASTRTLMTSSASWVAHTNRKTEEDTTRVVRGTDFAELMRRVLLQFFAPASVVTNLAGDIFYVHGETGKYLRPAPGQASLNVMKMAREGLGIELRAAINKAAVDVLPTINREIQVKTNGDFASVNLSVRLLSESVGIQNYLLVSFQELPRSTGRKRPKRISKPEELSRIEALERELSYLKECYQINLEEQQSSNEELRTTNEEMQSANEELQSTNEELETSKEELQSLNEELITVNSELQAKIEQLADIQNDMKNLLDNVNAGIIFLDRNLVIRRFTREASRLYHLLATDIGRPLNDIKCLAQGDDLTSAALSVLETLIPYEREMYLGTDTWLLARIQPYSTLENKIDGVVLTFSDISSRIVADRIKTQAVGQALEIAEAIVKTIREPFIVLDSQMKVISASQSFYQKFQLDPEQTIAQHFYELGEHRFNQNELQKMMEAVFLHQIVENQSVSLDIPGMGQHQTVLNARLINCNVGGLQLIMLSMEIGT